MAKNKALSEHSPSEEIYTGYGVIDYSYFLNSYVFTYKQITFPWYPMDNNDSGGGIKEGGLAEK